MWFYLTQSNTENECSITSSFSCHWHFIKWVDSRCSHIFSLNSFLKLLLILLLNETPLGKRSREGHFWLCGVYELERIDPAIMPCGLHSQNSLLKHNIQWYQNSPAWEQNVRGIHILSFWSSIVSDSHLNPQGGPHSYPLNAYTKPKVISISTL